ALELNPEDLFLIKYYALNLISLEKEEEAIEHLEIVLVEEPEDVETLVNLAICKANTKRYDEVLPLIEKIFALKPPPEDILMLLSMKLVVTIFKEKDVKEGLKIIDSSDLKNYPEARINAYIWFGSVLIQEKKYEKALLNFEISIELLRSLNLEHEYEVDGNSLIEDLDLLRETAQKEQKPRLLDKIDQIKSEFLTFKDIICNLIISL
ncbi:hypothetical protein LCGC14_2795340, partial [marine sediment metagenome]